MTFSASWYTQHPSEVVEETDPTVFEKMSRNEFASVVNRAAQSNSDLQAEALCKADSWCFQVAHQEYLRTAKNKNLINHWLTSQRITNPTYPDFDAAYKFLSGEGLLDIDGAELAKQQDQRGNRTFKGAITGREFTSLEEMIGFERQAALQKVPQATKEDIALDNLPIDALKTLLREGELSERVASNALQAQKNADAFLLLHPEVTDSDRNGRLILMQLKANGCTEGNASIEEIALATNQLRESGLLTLNKTVLTKQRAAEVKQLASDAVKAPGSVFDTTSEDEMYNLPMEELEKRARGSK